MPCLAASSTHSPASDSIVGMKDHVLVFQPDGQRVAQWERPAEGSYFTAIAAGDEDVVVADSAKSIVWRFNTDGKLLGKIGQRDQARNIPGFLITNREHFDLTIGPGWLGVRRQSAAAADRGVYDGRRPALALGQRLDRARWLLRLLQPDKHRRA